MVRVRIGDELHELTWEEWETRVRAGRIPPDAEVQFEAVTGSDWRRADDLEMYRSLRNDAAIAWRAGFLAGPPPLLTALLVGIQIRIWWFAQVPEIRSGWVHRFTKWTPHTLENAEVWRPLTMGVLHTHPLHILLNMLWLAYCGWNLERALGRANLLTLYVASVLGGSLLSMFGSPGSPSLGASGGVFGLVAASVAFGFARPELLPRRGRRLFGVAMLPYLVLMFWSGLMSEDTDNWSHLGGLITGGVLALLLDPVPLQRRPGWNRRMQVAVAVVTVLTLAVLGLAGPRLVPLVDSDEARLSFLSDRRRAVAEVDPDRYRALEWSVPVGWRPGPSPTGLSGFVSPAGPDDTRLFAVRTRSVDALMTSDDLAREWEAQVREDWPSAEISAPEPAVLAGHEGLTRTASFAPHGSDRVLRWWGVARGAWLLEAEWQVGGARAGWLSPLRDRAVASVVWRDPEALVEATRDVAYLPESPKARQALAEQLARVGRLDEAMEMHEELVREAPDDPRRWVSLLETVTLAGEAIPEPERWWTEALDSSPAPAVVIEIVRGLERRDRPDEALGLLEVAWIEAPGDRQLKRARRSRGLATHLDPASGAPWALVFDPATGDRRPEEEVERRQERATTLSSARSAAAELEADAARGIAAAVRAIESGDPAGLDPLLVLKDGWIPDADTDAREALLDDVDRAIEGRAARWMPAEVEAALQRHPDWPAAVRTHLGAQADDG